MKHLNRLLIGSALLACASTVMAGGGVAPLPGTAIFASKYVWKGIIKLKTYNVGDTDLADDVYAKQGTIQLLDARKGKLLSQVSFKARPFDGTTGFNVSLGCDTSVGNDGKSLTQLRFEGQTLTGFMSRSDVRLLFAPLGLVPNDDSLVGDVFVPGITAVTNPNPEGEPGELGECIDDPWNPAAEPADPNVPGAPDLYIEVVIQGCVGGGCQL